MGKWVGGWVGGDVRRTLDPVHPVRLHQLQQPLFLLLCPGASVDVGVEGLIPPRTTLPVRAGGEVTADVAPVALESGWVGGWVEEKKAV